MAEDKDGDPLYYTWTFEDGETLYTSSGLITEEGGSYRNFRSLLAPWLWESLNSDKGK